MDEIIKMLQEVSAEVWKNFKSHAQAFDPNNPEKFWADWKDDVDVLDNAYCKSPVKITMLAYLEKALAEATKEGLKNGIK